MIDKVLFAVIAPGLAAGIILLLAWRPFGRRTPVWGGSWSGAVALAGSFVASFVLVAGWPTIPLEARWHVVAPIAVAAAAIAIMPGLLGRVRGLGWVAALGAGAMTGLLFQPPPSVEHGWIWRIAIGASAAAIGLVLEPLAARRPGASVPMGLCVWLAASSIIITDAGVATIGLTVAAASAACGAMVLVAWRRPTLTASGGTVVTASAIGCAAMAVGWLWTRDYTHVPAASFALIAGAPCALWAGELRVVRSRRPWIGVMIRTACVALPVAIAVVLSMLNAADDPWG